MLSFRSLLEGVFQGFRVASDTALAQKLQQEGVQSVLVLKKSVYFMFFEGRLSYGILSLIGLCISLLVWYIASYTKFIDPLIHWLLYGFLLIHTIYWIYTYAMYCRNHKRSFHVYRIFPPAEMVSLLAVSDREFATLINQTGLLMFLHMLYAVSYAAMLFWLRPSMSWIYVIVYSLLSLLHAWQVKGFFTFFSHCIDLAMDFLLITPASIIYYNQSNFGLDTASLNAKEIKSVSSSKKGLFQSILNFGTISIILAGVDNMNEIIFPYMKAPETIEKVVTQIQGEKKLEE